MQSWNLDLKLLISMISKSSIDLLMLLWRLELRAKKLLIKLLIRSSMLLLNANKLSVSSEESSSWFTQTRTLIWRLRMLSRYWVIVVGGERNIINRKSPLFQLQLQPLLPLQLPRQKQSQCTELRSMRYLHSGILGAFYGQRSTF